MPFNLDNISEWITNVRGVSTTDQVEGGPGGVANFSASDLTRRTQWLYDNLLGTFIRDVQSVNTPQTLVAANVGRAYVVNGAHGGAITLPAANTVAPGKGFLFIHNAGPQDAILINRAGSDQIGVGGSTYTQVALKPLAQFWVISTGAGWRLVGTEPMRDVGSVTAFARNAPPAGWLACHGQEVSRTLYRDLFEQVGTSFGVGNGSTTFNLPDTRGIFLRGWGDGGIYDAFRAFGSLQAEMVGQHTHPYRDRYYAEALTSLAGATQVEALNGHNGSRGSGDTDTDNNRFLYIDKDTSNNSGTETRPVNLALLYCIRF